MEILSGNGNERAFWLNLFLFLLNVVKKCYNKNVITKFNSKTGPNFSMYQAFSFIFWLASLRAQWNLSIVKQKKNCCESGAQQFNYTYSFFVRRIRFQCLLSSFLLSLHFIYLYTPHTHTPTYICIASACAFVYKRLLLKIVVDRALLFSLHIIWTSQFIYCIHRWRAYFLIFCSGSNARSTHKNRISEL